MPERARPILHADFGAALAEFIAGWAGASQILSMTLSDLAAGKTLGPNDDMSGAMAHVGMDARVQFGLIRTMGLVRVGKANEKRLGKLIDRLEKSKKQRDFLAHANWSVDGKGRMVGHSLKTVGKVQLISRPLTTKDLEAEFDALTEAMNDLVKFFKAHGFLSGLQGVHGRFF
jgi:hypothetical protein